VPGQCNIGRAEIAQRMRFGIVAAAVTVALFVLLLALRAAPAWHLVLFVPATGAALGAVQAMAHFCVGLAFRALFNFGPPGGGTSVLEAAARRADRRRAWQLLGLSAGLGAMITGVAVAVSAAAADPAA
jgi:hypothetical protein